jgi:hypothetical protein
MPINIIGGGTEVPPPVESPAAGEPSGAPYDAAMLDEGAVIVCRYESQSRDSMQERRWRTLKVIEGPHFSSRHKHGAIIRAADLSDPEDPGREKCFYLHRMVEGRVCRFEATECLASKRARGEDVKKGARRVRFAVGGEGRGEKRARK